jgi:hypothetical protein
MPSKKVTCAKFHQSLWTPSTGELGNTLPAKGKTIDKLDMQATDAGLIVSGLYNKRLFSALVPYGNIVVLELSIETENNS